MGPFSFYVLLPRHTLAVGLLVTAALRFLFDTNV